MEQFHWPQHRPHIAAAVIGPWFKLKEYRHRFPFAPVPIGELAMSLLQNQPYFAPIAWLSPTGSPVTGTVPGVVAAASDAGAIVGVDSTGQFVTLTLTGATENVTITATYTNPDGSTAVATTTATDIPTAPVIASGTIGAFQPGLPPTA